MPAVDTNVVVRLLTGDDTAQHRIGLKLFDTEEIFIPDTVLLETEWVLRAAYGLAPTSICHAIKKILGLPNVTVANGPQVAQAVAWHEGGLDFADAFHLAQCQGQQSLKTFDSDFVKRAKALSECRVEKPG